MADDVVLAQLALALALYVYLAVLLRVLARKTGTRRPWLAWIPIANLWLLARVGRVSPWWLLALPVPLLNIAALIVLFAGAARARGRSGWWGALGPVPGLNLLVLQYLALGSAATGGGETAAPAVRPARPARRVPAPPPDPARCPACGQAAEPGDAFCGACGRDVRTP